MHALRFPLLVSLATILALSLYAGRYDAAPAAKTFLDRNGEVIGTIHSAYQGLQIWTPLKDIPQEMQNRTVFSEDRFFFWHRGINPISITEAAIENLLRGRVIRGGSTITQQLAKNLMPPHPRTFFNKFRETLLALGLEMKHSKAWILERYLNTVYYGRRSYGIAAAAQTYFGKDLRDLSRDEIGFLVTRPKAPNRTSPLAPLLTKERGRGEVFARHFLEYASPFLSDDSPVVQTTLDLDLQRRLEDATAQLLAGRASDDPLLNAAVIVIDVRTGELLAMVGSRDYFNDEIAGQVNAAVALRQPGSTLKPFTYFAAFTKGFDPDSIVPDEPFSFQSASLRDIDGESDGYAPQNFDRRYHGSMTIRSALANSYNIPAVVTLNEIGLSYYHDLLRKFGITSLKRPPTHYGLAITLGSGEVSLLELTNAYAALARGGMFLPYTFVRATRRVVPTPTPITTHADRFAAEVTGILSDPDARLKAFGFNDNMKIDGHEVAVKTGTSFEHRDNWTVGYTPSYAVGVWVGHSDGSPLSNTTTNPEGGLPTTGASGAAPLWHAAMENLLRGKIVEHFAHPRNNGPTKPVARIGSELAKTPQTWHVISPVPNTTYRLSRFIPNKHQKIAGIADNGRGKAVTLRWYLDGVYLDSTEGTGKSTPVWLEPAPGKHTLRVLDSNGEKQEIHFHVLESEDS